MEFDITFRLANVLHLSKLSTENLWSVIKKIKLKTPLDRTSCSMHEGLYEDRYKSNQVEAVEQELNMGKSEVRFQNVSKSTLKTATEMFIYLNSCPHNNALKQWFTSWSNF